MERWTIDRYGEYSDGVNRHSDVLTAIDFLVDNSLLGKEKYLENLEYGLGEYN